MVTPFEQALTYAESFPRNRQPRFVVVCNFSTFRVHDRDACPRAELAGKYVEFTLEELGRNPHLLDFVTDPDNSRSEREKQVSMEAGRLIGELHALLQAQYIDPRVRREPEGPQHPMRAPGVLPVLRGCGALPQGRALELSEANVEPKNMRVALKRLFKALDTPIEKRDPYDKSVKPFPYVNGGLFAEESEIPNFTDEIKFKLLFEVSQQTDWSQISPTIFGGIFELSPEPGDPPLGRYALHQPREHPQGDRPAVPGRPARGARLHPLAGGRNAAQKGRTPYAASVRSFRLPQVPRPRVRFGQLPHRDLPVASTPGRTTRSSELNDGEVEMVLGDETEEDTKRVTLSQFYGIEINDFAANVARTALWIAQSR